MRRVWVWVLLGAAAIMPACGQKGPLVLPDSHPHRPAAPAPTSTPAPAAPTTQTDEAKPDAPQKP